MKEKKKKKPRKEGDLGVGFGGVRLGLNGLFEGLDVFLDILRLVFVLETEGLVLDYLLLLG